MMVLEYFMVEMGSQSGTCSLVSTITHVSDAMDGTPRLFERATSTDKELLPPLIRTSSYPLLYH